MNQIPDQELIYEIQNNMLIIIRKRAILIEYFNKKKFIYTPKMNNYLVY